MRLRGRYLTTEEGNTPQRWIAPPAQSLFVPTNRSFLELVLASSRRLPLSHSAVSSLDGRIGSPPGASPSHARASVVLDGEKIAEPLHGAGLYLSHAAVPPLSERSTSRREG